MPSAALSGDTGLVRILAPTNLSWVALELPYEFVALAIPEATQ